MRFPAVNFSKGAAIKKSEVKIPMAKLALVKVLSVIRV